MRQGPQWKCWIRAASPPWDPRSTRSGSSDGDGVGASVAGPVGTDPVTAAASTDGEAAPTAAGPDLAPMTSATVTTATARTARDQIAAPPARPGWTVQRPSSEAAGSREGG